LTIVLPAGVTVHIQSACASEFRTLVSAAAKLVCVGEKITSSVIVNPYAEASAFTWATPSRPKPPLSPISAILVMPRLLRYRAML
jgi:hypothetical protein